jgi:tetratricopeptide (TPR) repeat protein
MFSGKLIRQVSVIALFFFLWFSITANFGFAQQEEDELLKARKLYQDGDYEGSIKLLSEFIAKLRAIVAQKKNVAEAFYLLAKVYYTVGEDEKVDENLQKVFETYPAFAKEEADFDFKARMDKARAEVEARRLAQKEEEKPVPAVKEEKKKPAKVIEAPVPKKKKKFPVLLVVGGVVVLGVVAALLLSGGKKDEKKEEFDIRGRWAIDERLGNETFQDFLTFTGTKLRGLFRDDEDHVGDYEVNGRDVHFSYRNILLEYQGRFTGPDNMAGTFTIVIDDVEYTGNWTGTRLGPAAQILQQARSITTLPGAPQSSR